MKNEESARYVLRSRVQYAIDVSGRLLLLGRVRTMLLLDTLHA